MKHISEIVDGLLPSLITSKKHCQDSKKPCQYTDEARAADAGLTVEEYHKVMKEAFTHQDWCNRMQEIAAEDAAQLELKMEGAR